MDTRIRLQQLVTSAAVASIREKDFSVNSVNVVINMWQDNFCALNLALYDLAAVKSAMRNTHDQIVNLVKSVVRDDPNAGPEKMAYKVLSSIFSSFNQSRMHPEEGKLLSNSFNPAVQYSQVSDCVFSVVPGYSVLSFSPNLLLKNTDAEVAYTSEVTPHKDYFSVVDSFIHMSSEPILGNSRYGVLPFQIFEGTFPVATRAEKEFPFEEYVSTFTSITHEFVHAIGAFFSFKRQEDERIAYENALSTLEEGEALSEPATPYGIDMAQEFDEVCGNAAALVSTCIQQMIVSYNPSMKSTYSLENGA